VNVIAAIVEANRPAVVFLPHAADWHSTHIGTHYLVLDALRRMPPEFSCHVVETEYWGAMSSPNLMVESSSEQLADLVAALSLHRGEMARNPYHLRLPAWMIDNVRRGSELVNGERAAAPDFLFATLYRLCRRTDGEIRPVADSPGNLACADRPDRLFMN
jgi:LmbE family N-acetylglucosaminyl deacetylase